MKRLKFPLAGLALLGFLTTGCQSTDSSNGNNLTTSAKDIKTTTDSVSYVLGKNMYQNFKRQGIEVNEKLVAKALIDATNERDTLIAEEQAKPLMREFQQKMMKKRRERMQQQRQQQGGSNGQSPGGSGQQKQQRLKEKLKEKMKKQRQQQQQGSDGSSGNSSQ